MREMCRIDTVSPSFSSWEKIVATPELSHKAFAPGRSMSLMVMGITHPQTCLVLHDRIRFLREAGFRVVLVCSPGPLLDRFAEREGIEVLPVPMRRSISPLADLRSFWLLYALLRRLKPDLTEFSTPKAGCLGSVAAFLSKVPARVYLLRGLRLETATGLMRGLLQWSERLASAASHVVLCNSESLRTRAVELAIAPPAKLCLLGLGSSNGVDVERFYPGPAAIRPSLFIQRSEPVVGFVGRLTRDKGIPELLDAFERILILHPTARLLCVGWFDDSEDSLDELWLQRLRHHPRVLITGMVADTAPYYRAMDVLVLPTWREGFPNVALEAAASGVPVVTTCCTGARDAVLPEVTGLLIPPGYPEAIAEAVSRLLSDPGLRLRLGRAARAWVQEQFLNSTVLGRTAQLYRRLILGEGSAVQPVLSEEAAAAAD